jgi:hypothetical protein
MLKGISISMLLIRTYFSQFLNFYLLLPSLLSETLTLAQTDGCRRIMAFVGTPDYPSGIPDMHTIHDPMISVS